MFLKTKHLHCFFIKFYLADILFAFVDFISEDIICNVFISTIYIVAYYNLLQTSLLLPISY